MGFFILLREVAEVLQHSTAWKALFFPSNRGPCVNRTLKMAQEVKALAKEVCDLSSISRIHVKVVGKN